MIEVVAAAYGWPPSEIDATAVDDLVWWAEAAVRRLRARR